MHFMVLQIQHRSENILQTISKAKNSNQIIEVSIYKYKKDDIREKEKTEK